MPRYEFLCEECQKRFEETLRMRDLEEAKPKCPGCGSEKVRRQVSQFSTVTSKKS